MKRLQYLYVKFMRKKVLFYCKRYIKKIDKYLSKKNDPEVFLRVDYDTMFDSINHLTFSSKDEELIEFQVFHFRIDKNTDISDHRKVIKFLNKTQFTIAELSIIFEGKKYYHEFDFERENCSVGVYLQLKIK